MAEDQPSQPSNKTPPGLQPVGSNNSRATSSNYTTGLMRTPSSPSMGHRASFAENLRGNPASPRTAHRTPSLSQAAVQELLNNPPVGKHAGQDFSGRDWKSIRVGEVVDREKVKFVEINTTVEEATNVLISAGSPNVVLLRDSPQSKTAIGTFDYGDLNAYLLLVVGLAQPDEDQISSFRELAQKGREGKPIPLKDVKDLGRKEPLMTLPHTAALPKAVEIFGSGIHRIVIVKEHTMDVVGVLTQLRLLQFFWEDARHFPAIEALYQKSIRELEIGSLSVIAINGDKPLTAALELMNNEGVTSLPVLDNQQNVVGNISNVDVKLLTKNTALPLLRSSCIHFISVILSERGVNDGKDSFPVFHVNPWSTLAHTVAKLVATKSHRMWVVESPSPASSGPPTPLLTPSTAVPPANPFVVTAATSTIQPPLVSPHVAAPPPTAISAAAIPGASLSGRLSGVVSLTDILNLFARASGLHPNDPLEVRRQRRRSSSASMRRSVDSVRSESISGGISRTGSVSGRR